MTLEQWITKYEKKAEKYDLLLGFSIYFEPDKGFFQWHVWNDVFEVNHSCTNDAQYMLKVANDMAKKRGCKIIRTAVKRNPASYMRLMKCTPNIPLSRVRPNGIFYWVFDKEVK